MKGLIDCVEAASLAVLPYTRGKRIGALLFAGALASAHLTFFLRSNGEPSRARTCDPLIKSQLLYQLSYRPISELRLYVRKNECQAYREKAANYTYKSCGKSDSIHEITRSSTEPHETGTF